MQPLTVKKEIVHQDKLGRELLVGDCVAYPSSNALCLGTITKLNPKMIKVVKIPSKYGSGVNKYPSDLIKLDGPEVTMYLLKYQAPK